MSIDCTHLINQLQQFPLTKTIPTQPPIASRPFLLPKRPSQPLTLVIKPLKEDSFQVVVEPLDPIISLKHKTGNGKFLVKGKGLNDFKTFRCYGLQENTIVHLSRSKNTSVVTDDTVSSPEAGNAAVNTPEAITAEPLAEQTNDMDQVFISKLKSVLDTKLDPTKSQLVLEQCLELIKQHL